MDKSRTTGVLLLVLVAMVGACGEQPDASSVSEPVDPALVTGGAAAPPLVIQGVAPTRPVRTTDGKQHLVYELLVTNPTAASVRITKVEVLDPECRGTPVATFTGDGLARILVVDVGDVASGTVGASGHAGVFVDLALPAPQRPPRRLAHRISIEVGPSKITVPGPVVPVDNDRALPLGPPLHGGNLIDLNGCCRGAHTRALLSVDGGLFVAQRYAIDFVRLDDNGEILAGDPAKNGSYFTFGAEIIAAGPGRIVQTRDTVAENIPTEPLPPATIDSAPGNFVVEALDDGRFALYAHIQTGQVRVHVGDRVSRGQVLGLVGNTGNSTGPHLHFHVTDGPSPLGSNGLPYVFDRFDLQATIDLEDPTAEVVFVPSPQRRRDLLPMAGDVVSFP
jgi:hypothetical protein